MFDSAELEASETSTPMKTETPAKAGESDAGVFDLSLDAYLDQLLEYERNVERGSATGERNFLPFVPWLAARADVRTVHCTDAAETIGVNTPGELQAVEAYLRSRSLT